MKKIIKNTIVFASVLILSLMTSIIFMGSRVKAAALGDESFSVEYDDIDEYYGKKAPEYQDGYLFAGWYTDEGCTSSYVRNDGDGVTTFYAKFVPQAVLSVKAQHAVALHNKVLADTDKGSIRFVTATDSNNYNEVGLHVEGTIGSHTLDTDYKVGTIYSYLYVVGDITNDQSNPVAASKEFGTDAAKFFAPHAFKINFTQFGDDFTITPYWVTPDGVRVDGVTRTRNMIENLEDNSYAEVNGRAYYTSNDLSTIYNTYVVNEETFVGTEESPTKITLLKNHVSMTALITIKGSRNILIQNKANTDVTLSRTSEDGESVFTTNNMFVINGGSFLQLGATDLAHTGTLIVDGETSTAVGYRTVYVKESGKFVLQKNATLQNAFSTKSGAAIVNIGTSDLYGNMLNNTSNNSNSSAYGAGAILQGQNSGTLTIHSGTYEGNKNTGTYGAGGVIGTQIINTDGELAGPITIEGGTFSNNSAAYGGVVSSYTTNKVTISGGAFTSNGTQKNEADEVISACEEGGVVYLFEGATLDITGGEFNSNQADTYGGVISTKNLVGEISITGGKFTSNYAGTYGGVVSIARRGELNIDGGSFSGNSAGSYGGVISTTQGNTASNGATINITNGEFTANTGTTYGGVVYVNKSGKLTIGGGTFSGNSATSNGGVISTAEGFNTTTDEETGTETITALPITVTIDAGTFTSNSATTDGGVVLINKYASLTVNNGTFNENTGTTNGAVISTIDGSTSDNAPKITINNGTFTSNEGTYGGVVFVDKYVSLDVVDGRFSSNKAKNGGVIGSVTGTSATLRAVVNITDGEFTSNSATQHGGVAHLGAYGKVTVDGGKFSQNSATTNGGVISAATSSSTAGGVTVVINNGTFQNNQAGLGGVVAVMNYAKLEMTGGSFTNNESTTYGGGVVYVCVATAEISGATMTGNCAPGSKPGYYRGGAISIHRASTVTLENCTIHGNTHDGSLSDESKNINGCDIAFSGGNEGNTSKLILADSSFTGIVGHMSNVEKATLQVEFSDGTKDTVDYTKLYSADYEQPALVENVTYQVLLVSDMHYTTNLTESEYKSQYSLEDLIFQYGYPRPADVCGPTFGYSQDDKIGEMFADINGYIESNGAINSLMLLGDISIDNKGYSNLKDDFLKLFKETYLTEDLAYDWHALAGDHDSYTNDEWKAIMGCDRQYSVEVGNAVFIMLDNFAATHATSNSGSEYDGIDIDFLTTELAKYPDKSIFLCSHYYAPNKNTENDTAFMALLNQYDNIVCMFRGHSHNSAYYSAGSLGGFPIIDIGGYAYNDKAYVTNDDGTKNFNVFEEDYAWGYQVLQWNNSTAHVYHVKNARDYTDYDDVVHRYTGAIEDDRFIGLR